MPSSSSRVEHESEFEPRYCPDRPFPKYAFVPGVHPHPVSDSAGHLFGSVRPELSGDAAEPKFREEFLFGVDLFNAGYYWEAHEAWECLWIACGRKGQRARLLQGLIKLAAAGVKCRTGNGVGVGRHASRAVELLSESRELAKDFGIQNLDEVIQFAREIVDSPIIDTTETRNGRVVLPMRLVLSIAFLETGFQ